MIEAVYVENIKVCRVQIALCKSSIRTPCLDWLTDYNTEIRSPLCRFSLAVLI